jgi:hypothetical protein
MAGAFVMKLTASLKNHTTGGERNRATIRILKGKVRVMLGYIVRTFGVLGAMGLGLFGLVAFVTAEAVDATVIPGIIFIAIAFAVWRLSAPSRR